ncbi:MAG: hypothetical protein GWP58_03820 [Gammaproteobacteria bacterium]|jgi:hypothetical protein|nr:hypothetical protein [Gammaproteobacteria bacterium]
MIRIISWALFLLAPLQVSADAIVRSTAMFADTIAEYFVETDHVRLELEIGEADIASFRNLLPSSIYQQLGFGDEPLEDRLQLFTSRDLAIFNNGEPLAGFVRAMGPATRSLRDEVTGEELPTAEQDATLVIGATLVFPFEGRPDSLTLMAPVETGLANIGFVLYHQGVAVNDYRYLSSGYTVNLDWEDPWYSSFPQRALKRQYESPMTGFIYVEPFEVRKEIIVRPHDIQQWVDLGLEGQDVIRAGQQDEIKRRVVEFLAPHFRVKIDGVAVEGTLDRVNFLRRTLKSSTVVDNQDIALLPATLGVIYVFPTAGLPQSVEMEWDVFTEKMQRVPTASVDQAGPLPVILEPDFNILRWDNYLKFPDIPTLVDIQAPPGPVQKISSWGRWVALGLSLTALAAIIGSRRKNGKFSVAAVVSLVVSILATLFLVNENRQSSMNSQRLQQLAGNLLHNVYRAFDYRGEEVIYDVLSRSASGELLTDIYLETRRGLELANQGGARVKVKDIEVLDAVLVETNGDSLTVDSKWNVSGSVGHWGHVHQRRNGYHAMLEISEMGGVWKLTGLEILEEERL